MESFLDEVTSQEKNAFNRMRELIKSIDENVEESVGKIMSIDKALVYEQEGVFKYGLAKTKNHFTFHSMVMYVNPEIQIYIKENGKGLIVQKGCVNFENVEKFSLDLFEKILLKSSLVDFSSVIKYYKSKK